MKQTVNFSEFCDGFRDMNRNDNFSYDGKVALFEYLEELENDCGTEIEFDVIALCCGYTEYESLEEFHKNYDKGTYPNLDTLRDYTQVIEFDKGFIIADF